MTSPRTGRRGRSQREELTFLSEKVVIMSERAMGFLVAQGVPRQKIGFIHHGIPDLRADRDTEKARLGLSDRSLILTFGLLSPNKGIETALRAMPAVTRDVPDATYLVLGATHPHVRAQHGEVYREGLRRLAADLGVAGHVRFDDGFAEPGVITRALAAADVCLFPYRNREQITSGTLAYAFGNGKAVVSTPFWHAEELLAEGRGVLVPFCDPDAFGAALRGLLRDPGRLAAMEARACNLRRADALAERRPHVPRRLRRGSARHPCPALLAASAGAHAGPRRRPHRWDGYAAARNGRRR